MRTKEEAEEVKVEIENRMGILKQYLINEIEQDQYCDGSGYYISIR